MDLIEKEIEKARNANSFLGALVLSLTLPSVCSYYEYKDLEKYGDNEYHLHIPYAGDDYVLNYTVGENKIERPFCAAALIVHILTGYEEFKEDYPDFKYPLEYREG